MLSKFYLVTLEGRVIHQNDIKAVRNILDNLLKNVYSTKSVARINLLVKLLLNLLASIGITEVGSISYNTVIV